MKDKQKIVCIYLGVAVISMLILVTTYLIRPNQTDVEQEIPYYAQQDDLQQLLTLEKDLVLKRQDG
jgi:hypothetical protein